MNLSLQQTEHIAKLSKLNLSDGEIGKFQKQLSSILGYIKLLDEVDTTKVKPTAQTTGLKNIYQKDEPQNTPGEPRWICAI